MAAARPSIRDASDVGTTAQAQCGNVFGIAVRLLHGDVRIYFSQTSPPQIRVIWHTFGLVTTVLTHFWDGSTRGGHPLQEPKLICSPKFAII